MNTASCRISVRTYDDFPVVCCHGLCGYGGCMAQVVQEPDLDLVYKLRCDQRHRKKRHLLCHSVRNPDYRQTEGQFRLSRAPSLLPGTGLTTTPTPCLSTPHTLPLWLYRQPWFECHLLVPLLNVPRALVDAIDVHWSYVRWNHNRHLPHRVQVVGRKSRWASSPRTSVGTHSGSLHVVACW